MKVELIVLDVDGGEMLRRCLSSIERQSVKPERVLIVDNASRDPVAGRIDRMSVATRVIRTERNLGFAGGVNLAMAAVEADAVGLINNDVELSPEWLALLLSELEADPRLAAVQPVIARPDGTLDGAGISVRTGRFLQIGHGQRPDAPLEKAWGVSATASLYRTEALREVAAGDSLFHPAFFAYYEDVDLCARLLARGWGLRVVGRLLAVHAGSASSGRLGQRAVFLRTRNRYWVMKLHAVGQLGALLAEDARLILREMARLRLGTAATRMSGVVSGLFTSPGTELM